MFAKKNNFIRFHLQFDVHNMFTQQARAANNTVLFIRVGLAHYYCNSCVRDGAEQHYLISRYRNMTYTLH